MNARMVRVLWAAAMIVAAASPCFGEGLEGLPQDYRRSVLSGPTGEAGGSGRVDGGVPSWMQLGERLTVRAEAAGAASTDAASQPAERPPEPAAAEGQARRFVPWQERRGPAFPDDKWASFGRDALELPDTLWADTKHTAVDPVFIVGMTVAGAAGIALHNTNADDSIADRVEGHRKLNKFWDSTGDSLGNPGTHFAVAGAMYVTGLAAEDTKFYETSKSLMNALIINGVLTEGLKLAVHTKAPNESDWAWPSGHTSSTFALATVMNKAYGPLVGVPLFGFAGFVGYERIDARTHDFSDVISGMIMGIVIGNAVGDNHQMKVFGMDLVPYVDPGTGATGLALTKTW
jgi:hypothetical protein